MKKNIVYLSIGVIFLCIIGYIGYIGYLKKTPSFLFSQQVVEKIQTTNSSTSTRDDNSLIKKEDASQKDLQKNDIQQGEYVSSGVHESLVLPGERHLVIQEIGKSNLEVLERVDESEDLLIKKNNDYVKRDIQGLHLKISQAGEKIIQDNLSDADVDIGKFQRNYFKDFRRDVGFYIIGTGLYEGGFYKLINASTGKEYTTGGYPYFSPDGKYILTTGFDIEAGYSFNGLELFENNQGNLILLKKYDPSKWGALSVQWIDNTSARVKAKSLEFIDHEMVEHEMYLNVMIAKE